MIAAAPPSPSSPDPGTSAETGTSAEASKSAEDGSPSAADSSTTAGNRLQLPAAVSYSAQASNRAERLDEGSAFGWPFWCTYISNASMMVAVSLLFRYADFVNLLGGNEWQLGLIAGVGMVGSLLMRAAQGVGIDALGPRRIWLFSSGLFVFSCLAHLTIGRVDGLAIFIVRILYQISVAGFYGASITFISGRSPIGRIAEVVGSLGSSGFVGMAIGSTLGDWVIGSGPVDRYHVNEMFLLAAGLGLFSSLFAALATRGSVVRVKRRSVPLLSVLGRYHPGPVLLVAVAMGFGLGLPPVFLRPYLAQLGINDIRIFFYFYTLTAFVTRLSIRRLPARLGVRRMVAIGMASLITAMLLFITVSQMWHLLLPALALGIAHAFLFPAVVAAGGGCFPVRYRGLGTTFVLALFDCGALIGAPTVGAIIDSAPLLHLPGYATMFSVVAALLVLILAAYLLLDRKTQHGPRGRVVRRRKQRRRPSSPTVARVARV